MPVTQNQWTFTALRSPALGPMTLNGWSAPFGRPRQGALFDAGIEVRYTRTDYPSGPQGTPPTIHAFGTKLKAFEIHGRWMDQTIPGMNAAQGMVSDWKAFVGQQYPVRATWGSIISYIIFIHDCSLKFESPAEVVWELKAETLVDEQQPYTAQQGTLPTPFDIASAMAAEMSDLNPFDVPSFASLAGMLSSITDALSNIMATINAPFAAITSTCQQLSSFETAMSSDLGNLGSAVQGMQTALLNLRQGTDTMLSAAAALNAPGSTGANDIATGLITGESMAALASAKQASDKSTSNLLALLASMYTQIQRSTRGSVMTTATGQSDVSWEQMGINVLGTPDGGRSIRQMNGVKYSGLPVAGKVYSVPSKIRRV